MTYIVKIKAITIRVICSPSREVVIKLMTSEDAFFMLPAHSMFLYNNTAKKFYSKNELQLHYYSIL